MYKNNNHNTKKTASLTTESKKQSIIIVLSIIAIVLLVILIFGTAFIIFNKPKVISTNSNSTLTDSLKDINIKRYDSIIKNVFTVEYNKPDGWYYVIESVNVNPENGESAMIVNISNNKSIIKLVLSEIDFKYTLPLSGDPTWRPNEIHKKLLGGVTKPDNDTKTLKIGDQEGYRTTITDQKDSTKQVGQILYSKINYTNQILSNNHWSTIFTPFSNYNQINNSRYLTLQVQYGQDIESNYDIMDKIIESLKFRY